MAKLAYFKRLFTDSVKPTVAVSRGRFVGADGNQLSVAGAKMRGVSQDSFAPTEASDSVSRLTITLEGIEIVIAGGNVNPNARVTSDNQGCAVAVAADQAVNGIALNDTAAVLGDEIPVLLLSAAYEPAADTSGATLANLEIEVNKLKAALRSKVSRA